MAFLYVHNITVGSLQLELRIENEKYFRQHPEISSLLGLFVRKILDDRPDSILEYAGTFFDRAELRDVVEQALPDACEPGVRAWLDTVAPCEERREMMINIYDDIS